MSVSISGNLLILIKELYVSSHFCAKFPTDIKQDIHANIPGINIAGTPISPNQPLCEPDVPDCQSPSPPLPPQLPLRATSPTPPPVPLPQLDADNDDDEAAQPAIVPHLKEMEIALKYIKAIESASLESEIEVLDTEFIKRIRNPPTCLLTIENPDHCLSLDIFLAITNASELVYNLV